MKTLIIKSLLTSLCQREGNYPSLVKRGEGRFFNNDALLINFLVSLTQIVIPGLTRNPVFSIGSGSRIKSE